MPVPEDTSRMPWFAARARGELVFVMGPPGPNSQFIFAANPASFTIRLHPSDPNLFYVTAGNGAEVICLNWRLVTQPPLSNSADRSVLVAQLLTLSFVDIAHRSASGTSAIPGPNDAVLALRINITDTQIFKNAYLTGLTGITTAASTRISIYKNSTIAGGVWVPASGASFVEINNAPVVTSLGPLLRKDILFQTQLDHGFNLDYPITINDQQNLVFVVDNNGAGVTDFTVNWLDNEPNI